MRLSIFIFLLSVITVTSCSTDNRTEDDANSQRKKIEKILDMPAIQIAQPGKSLWGTWEAIELGEVLTGARFRLPSKLDIRDNNSYEYNVKFGNILFEGNGNYLLDTSGEIYKIVFSQIYPRPAKYYGIFNFASNDLLRIIFYREDFLPAPIRFERESIQIFKRIN